MTFVFAIFFSLNTYGSCEVSSVESENTGHCRREPGGTADLCYGYGTGPACSGSIPVIG